MTEILQEKDRKRDTRIRNNTCEVNITYIAMDTTTR